MKVALCLSGQPRVIEVGYQKLKAALLDYNDVDVFVHTWFDPDNLSTESVIPGREGHRLDSRAIEKISEIYKPRVLIVEKPKIWNRHFYYPSITFQKAHTWAHEIPGDGNIEKAEAYLDNTTHCMWYSIMMSNLMKERYATETNTQYDWVIRNRMDYGPHVQIEFTEPPDDDTAVYYQHNPDHPDGMVGDWYAMGSTNAMNVYCGLFTCLGQLVRQSNEVDGYWCNELILKHHLDNNSINKVGGDYQVHY